MNFMTMWVEACGKVVGALLKVLFTAIVLLLVIALFFLPVVFFGVAHVFPHATAGYLWQNLSEPGRGGDIIPLQICYVAALVILYFLVKGAVLLVRGIWERL